MEVIIREMEPKEAMSVWKLGIVTFHSMEGIFMGKPKKAVIALHEDKIVGGVTYNVYKYNGGTLGYVDYAFVDHHCHGQGIGKQLYEATVKRLYELGCTQVFGLVRGDNPGSFRLFEKQEMYRCTLKEAHRVLGKQGLLRMVFTTMLGWGPSMDCYLSNVTPRRDSAIQIFWYLFINLLIFLCGIPQHKQDMPLALAAAATVMAAGTLFGASILLNRKSNYHFRLSIGGYFVSMIVAFLGGLFPMTGKWFPNEFNHSKKQQKELCFAAVVEWLGILCFYIVIKEWLPDIKYWNYVSYYCEAMTIFRMIPSFPFNEYGGRRVYQCNKWLYVGLWVISAAVLYFI